MAQSFPHCITTPTARHRYPPKVLTDLYFKWARTVDPLLYENPMWWQSIEWINLLVLTPYALLAIVGFPLGWRWLRNPGMIVSSFTFYSLAVIIPTTLCVPPSCLTNA